MKVAGRHTQKLDSMSIKQAQMMRVKLKCWVLDGENLLVVRVVRSLERTRGPVKNKKTIRISKRM